MNVFNHFILFFTFLNALSEFDTENKDYVTDSWARVVQLYAPNIRKSSKIGAPSSNYPNGYLMSLKKGNIEKILWLLNKFYEERIVENKLK